MRHLYFPLLLLLYVVDLLKKRILRLILKDFISNLNNSLKKAGTASLVNERWQNVVSDEWASKYGWNNYFVGTRCNKAWVPGWGIMGSDVRVYK